MNRGTTVYNIFGLLPVTSGEPQNVSKQRPSVFGVERAQQVIIGSRCHTSDTYTVVPRFTRFHNESHALGTLLSLTLSADAAMRSPWGVTSTSVIREPSGNC